MINNYLIKHTNIEMSLKCIIKYDKRVNKMPMNMIKICWMFNWWGKYPQIIHKFNLVVILNSIKIIMKNSTSVYKHKKNINKYIIIVIISLKILFKSTLL
jgi:hypothetical protein